ncbi:MAG: acetyl-CoA carboxylase biotin carboxyl carrier protein subunit [Alphaproteobacteria bacterium]|nr:acetyl-CoA carboxylase biotin carboxyl carrier protein subunit [Alphaproteobacteria bacterium]
MELTEDDVLEILNLIERSHFDYFRLQSAELNLTVSKGGYIPPNSRGAPAPPPPVPAEEVSSPAALEPTPRPEEPPVPDGLQAIAAPMVGTFYRSPEPGADPFVELGARVEADTTVGLVEVMKVFTSVPAGTKGTISEIKVANAQFVEKGTVLFLVTPDDAPTNREARR